MLKFDYEKLLEQPWVPIVVIITSGLLSFGIVPHPYSQITMGTFISSSILLLFREYRLWLFFNGMESDRKLYQELVRIMPYREIEENHGMGRIFRKDFLHLLDNLQSFLDYPTNFFLNKRLNRLRNDFLSDLKIYRGILDNRLFPLNEDSYTLGDYDTFPEGHEALRILVNEISQKGDKLRRSYANLLAHCKSKLRT